VSVEAHWTDLLACSIGHVDAFQRERLRGEEAVPQSGVPLVSLPLATGGTSGSLKWRDKCAGGERQERGGKMGSTRGLIFEYEARASRIGSLVERFTCPSTN
jgi:hypothetical protein